MKIHVENIPACPVVYMRRVGAYGEQNFKLMQTMKEWIRQRNLWTESGTIYAIAQDNPSLVPPEKCRYDVCYVTEQGFDDVSIHSGTLPAGMYLVCQVPHTSQDVQAFWGAIGNVLASEKKILDENRPVLERYSFSLVEKGYCEFCIPFLV